MDPGRWRQIEHLYHAALEKEPSERALFLEEACAGDPSLRQEIESLLSYAGEADGRLKAAVLEVASQASGVNAAALPEHDLLTGAPGKLGRYELMEQIGKGGMGVVYRAFDPTIGRTVAIKTIPLDDAAGEKSSELRVRLLRESQAGGRLSHPHIVAVHDICEEGNTAYIVMEYVVGRTLDQAINNDPSLRSSGEALRIVQECASALDYAHHCGVVHRDIKPANIMLQADNSVKIADFGIAKIAQMTQLTQSAVIIGSPHYMAPEQWRGEPASGQTDQYALAAVAYAMLTGRSPFEGDTMASLAAMTLYAEPPAAVTFNPALNPAVDQVLRKALSKTGAARYGTCGEFAVALRTANEKSPISSFAQPTSPTGTAAPRKPIWLAGAVVASLVAVLAAGGWLYHRNSAAQLEVAYWISVKDSKDRGPFDAYLNRYPQGQFTDLAKEHLEALKKGDPTTANPGRTATQSRPQLKVKAKEIRDKPSQNSGGHPVVSPADPLAAGNAYAQGDALLKRGAYAEAVPFFTKAIAIEPAYRFYFGRAGAYQRLNRPEQAIDDYSQAISLNPKSAMAYHDRAV